MDAVKFYIVKCKIPVPNFSVIFNGSDFLKASNRKRPKDASVAGSALEFLWLRQNPSFYQAELCYIDFLEDGVIHISNWTFAFCRTGSF